jgi:hypothetical protein
MKTGGDEFAVNFVGFAAFFELFPYFPKLFTSWEQTSALGPPDHR